MPKDIAGLEQAHKGVEAAEKCMERALFDCVKLVIWYMKTNDLEDGTIAKESAQELFDAIAIHHGALMAARPGLNAMLVKGEQP